jgi:hypothetical protein
MLSSRPRKLHGADVVMVGSHTAYHSNEPCGERRFLPRPGTTRLHTTFPKRF